MLIENEKHEKYHKTGPRDIKDAVMGEDGKQKLALCTISATRSTLDNEQMSISIPVFVDDSREDLDLRVGMLMSILQDRIDDAAEAWDKVAVKAATQEHEDQKKALLDQKKKNRRR